MPFTESAMDWLRRALDLPDAPLDIAPLPGATSSAVFRVQSNGSGATRRSVLRVLNNSKWLSIEPDLAEHEAAALQEAERADLPAPRLIAFSATDVGFGAPVVLMTYVDGDVWLRPQDTSDWIAALARQLSVIHRHDAATFPWRFKSWVEESALTAPESLRWSSFPERWERAIAIYQRGAPKSKPVFLHRDYHPANVLWQNKAISGVVDWINACRGPAGVDVANCCLDLAQIMGPDAADIFLDRYSAANDAFDYHPYWEIDALLDRCLAEPPFYSSWEDFGIGPICQDVMRQRVDSYLERVLGRC